MWQPPLAPGEPDSPQRDPDGRGQWLGGAPPSVLSVCNYLWGQAPDWTEETLQIYITAGGGLFSDVIDILHILIYKGCTHFRSPYAGLTENKAFVITSCSLSACLSVYKPFTFSTSSLEPVLTSLGS